MPNLASSEQGLADFEAPTWFAVFLRRGASEPIFRKLNQAAFATADTPSVQDRLHVLASRWWKDELTDTIRLDLRATAKLVVFATSAMTNRHPADELADIRRQIKALKTRETKLRDALLNAEQSERIGEEWIAEVSQQKRHRLDNDALKKHFGLEALQPFVRESMANLIKLISIQAGKQRRHKAEQALRPIHESGSAANGAAAEMHLVP